MLDVAAFETLPVPFEATFWRATFDGTRCMDRVNFRCVLFDEVLGLSPDSALAIDTLHTFYYGPVLRWMSVCFWRLIMHNPWNISGSRDQRIELGVRRLSLDLSKWSEDENIPRERRVSELTLKMLGEPPAAVDDQTFAGGTVKLKAAETSVVVRFALHELKAYGGGLRNSAELVAGGQALVDLMDALHDAPLQLSGRQLQKCWELAQRHMVSCERCGIRYLPKHHLFMHMIARTATRACVTVF